MLNGPTGPTGLYETVNVASTGPTGTCETVFTMPGPTGATGTFRTLIGATGATGKRTVLLGSLGKYTTNLKRTNLAQLRSQYRNGAGNTIIAFNGDSTTRGVDFSAAPVNSQYPNALPPQLAAIFNTAGIVAGSDNWFGLSGTNLADYTTRDSRITVGGGTVFGSNKYQGGTEIRFPGVASTFSFTPPDQVDTFEIYWADQGVAARTMSYQVDSGSVVNLATTGSAVQRKTVVTTTLGAHTLNMAWVSGGTTLVHGINAYNSARREVSLWNMGISGGVSANMIDDSGAPQQGRLQQFKNWTPHLIITEMGLVNDWRNSVAVATSQAAMDTFASFVKNTLTGCDLIFLAPPYDNGTGTGNAANQNQYVAAMYTVAAKYDVPVIDIRQKWLSYANAVANGWQVAGDNVHPTKLGYIDQAGVIATALQAAL